MDIGVYQLKYAARRLIRWVLPLVSSINPNTITLSIFPVGIAIGLFCYFGLNGYPSLLLGAIFLTGLRMFLSTLDGLLAVHLKKESASGELLNRLIPEICDTIYLLAIMVARPDYFFLGAGVLIIAWLTSFSGLIGIIVGKPIQSVGPVGQTDRLVAFIFFVFLHYLFLKVQIPVDCIVLFLWWCLIGGMVTICLRLVRNFKKS